MTHETSTPLPRIILPALESVSEQLHESCSAAILDGPDIVYVARSATKRIMSVGLAIGLFVEMKKSTEPALCLNLVREERVAVAS